MVIEQAIQDFGTYSARKLELLASIYNYYHPELRPEMGRRGREHVEKEYDVRQQVGKLESIYDRLVGL